MAFLFSIPAPRRLAAPAAADKSLQPIRFVFLDNDCICAPSMRDIPGTRKMRMTITQAWARTPTAADAAEMNAMLAAMMGKPPDTVFGEGEAMTPEEITTLENSYLRPV